MEKTFGYARVSTSSQVTDRQIADLLTAGVAEADVYVDHGVSGRKASRPALDSVLALLREGDSLTVCTLDRLGRETRQMLDFAEGLERRGVALRVLNLGGAAVDTRTAIGKMLFTVMAALAEMELAIKDERSLDSVQKRRAQGGDLGGRRETVSEDAFRGIERDLETGRTLSEACRERGVSRQAFYRMRERLGGMPST